MEIHDFLPRRNQLLNNRIERNLKNAKAHFFRFFVSNETHCKC
ncbi:malate synthase [Enterococcus casseliflavus]|nr:malate synthase [Enterococcus casseliflavus]MBO1145059.1 malate synthase [Enterococcus casseliflavus]